MQITPRWKSFMAFDRLIVNHLKLFQHNNTASSNSPVSSRVWQACNSTMNVLSELQLSSTTVKLQTICNIQ